MPANPGNQFQRKWTDEEYAHAIELALAPGHGTIKHASEQTGIPYETLRKKVLAHIQYNTPPLPQNNPGAHMAREALETLHVAIYRQTNPVTRRSGNVDVKALKEAGEAVKLWSQILREDKTPRAPQAPKSALEALNGGKTAA